MLVDFHSVYERYARDVFRFALYLSGDPSLAEEITQDTFVRAWVVPGEICGGTVKAYLLTIARNLYRAERKRTARHASLDGVLVDRRPGPEAVARGRMGLDAVLEAMQSLAEDDRAALLMHAQDALPYADIAKALGVSTAAVRVRVHRARMKLADLCDRKEGQP
jgi:RNA polymerase sigma-70 factor (ECF subfamily)